MRCHATSTSSPMRSSGVSRSKVVSWSTICRSRCSLLLFGDNKKCNCSIFGKNMTHVALTCFIKTFNELVEVCFTSSSHDVNESFIALLFPGRLFNIFFLEPRNTVSRIHCSGEIVLPFHYAYKCTIVPL